MVFEKDVRSKTLKHAKTLYTYLVRNNLLLYDRKKTLRIVKLIV